MQGLGLKYIVSRTEALRRSSCFSVTEILINQKNRDEDLILMSTHTPFAQSHDIILSCILVKHNISQQIWRRAKFECLNWYTELVSLRSVFGLRFSSGTESGKKTILEKKVEPIKKE